VASVVVAPGNRTLHSLGETVQLTATVKDAAGNTIEGRAVTWTTANANVATVTSGALVQAVNEGESVITATVDGVSGNTKVFIEQLVTAIEIVPAQIDLHSFDEVGHFTATPRDALGHVVEGRVLSWASSAPAIVGANTSGGVIAVANGTATIAVSLDGIAATGTVNVAQTPAKLAFVTQPLATQNGVTMPKVDVQVRDALGTLVADATNQVTLALAAVPGITPLTGTTQVAATAGVASFTTLAIGTPATGYTFVATASGLTPVSSNAFEIMNVPIRADSVKLADNTIKINGTLNYTVWITNGEGKNATQVGVQAWILQGQFTNAAGGTNVIGCTAAGGVVAAGTCRTDASLNATVGTFVAGPATVRIDFNEGGALRGSFTFPITIVP
jgi:hypothetical protein